MAGVGASLCTYGRISTFLQARPNSQVAVCPVWHQVKAWRGRQNFRARYSCGYSNNPGAGAYIIKITFVSKTTPQKTAARNSHCRSVEIYKTVENTQNQPRVTSLAPRKLRALPVLLPASLLRVTFWPSLPQIESSPRLLPSPPPRHQCPKPVLAHSSVPFACPYRH